MNGRYENGALPEKVRLLYEAVLAMVTDGWDINRMKVSDITAQAGIGKGTAYEYFSSKEEIIANAILYDVETRLAHVLEITKGEGDFAGKFVQILTYMEEVFAKRQAFCLLVRIGTGSYEVSESMRRECEKRQQALGCHLADRIVESLMCQGVSEGTIGETNPYLQKLAFVAQMTAFAGYLVDLEKGEKMAVSREEAKRFVYEALVKSLN